jgi:N-acetylmuramoyl-L-alanine amidase
VDNPVATIHKTVKLKIMKLKALCLSLVAMSLGCNTTTQSYKTPVAAYNISNELYKKQMNKYAQILSEYPIQDSVGLNHAPFWVGTTNFNMRKPNFVIIHHTAQTTCEQTLKTFTLERTKVSAHYVICRDGIVHHMLNDYLRAWHAGVAKWGSTTDINSASIGIELDNDGSEPFADAQMNSLMDLLDRLKKAHDIPTANFIGHADIAPTRKNDPNINFNWELLSSRGFGYWYSDTTNTRPPADFNALLALRIIGYNMKDTTASIVTFKRKFLKDEKNKQLNTGDRKVLFSLVQKYF